MSETWCGCDDISAWNHERQCVKTRRVWTEPVVGSRELQVLEKNALEVTEICHNFSRFRVIHYLEKEPS